MTTTTTMTPFQERFLALFERLVKAQEAQAAAKWAPAHIFWGLTLLATIAIFVWGNRHDFRAWRDPAAVKKEEVEKVKAKEKAKLRARKDFEKEEKARKKSPPPAA
ncbi:hypothetical protein diail_8885 [Diaporthe ilicicola]|nr:hypothetical protein diail_8885 [Diaporthe ilicicola]